jgi:3-oxoacid CoA-transferase subunit A
VRHPERPHHGAARRRGGRLETVSNNAGVDQWGLGLLLAAKRIRRTVASYVGENKEFERQFLSGELEVELTPQGRWPSGCAPAARHPRLLHPGRGRHAGGRGRAAAALRRLGRCRAGQRAEGGPRVRRREYVLERAITTDFALVHARYGDRHGNLVYEKAAQNFNPLCAAAGRVTVAQVEELVSRASWTRRGAHARHLRAARRARAGRREADRAADGVPC